MADKDKKLVGDVYKRLPSYDNLPKLELENEDMDIEISPEKPSRVLLLNS